VPMAQHSALSRARLDAEVPQRAERNQSGPFQEQGAVAAHKRPRRAQLLVASEEKAPVVEKVARQEECAVCIRSRRLPPTPLMHVHPLLPFRKVAASRLRPHLHQSHGSHACTHAGPAPRRMPHYKRT
jgi:hypothetical protein